MPNRFACLKRLGELQMQLVTMKAKVLDLWSCCKNDSKIGKKKERHANN